MPEERPSERVVQQRMRNRAIEALEPLAQGDNGVRKVGVVDYVENFFDIIDDRSRGGFSEDVEEAEPSSGHS